MNYFACLTCFRVPQPEGDVKFLASRNLLGQLTDSIPATRGRRDFSLLGGRIHSPSARLRQNVCSRATVAAEGRSDGGSLP
jgi:hypothetical protein